MNNNNKITRDGLLMLLCIGGLLYFDNQGVNSSVMNFIKIMFLVAFILFVKDVVLFIYHNSKRRKQTKNIKAFVYEKKSKVSNDSEKNNSVLKDKVENEVMPEVPKAEKIINRGYKLPNVDLLTDESKVLIPFLKEMEGKDEIIIPIGKSSEKIVVEKLNNMPNLLIGGTVMSGKTTFVNSIIASILLTKKPDDVKFVIFDSKVVDYSFYNGIPHLLMPVVTDPRKASAVLQRIVVEMDDRFIALEEKGAKNVKLYNKNVSDENRMPTIIVVIDDISALSFDEVNDSIERLSANGWKVNIFMIVTSNHPTARIMSTVSKSNFPARMCFKVASARDSQVIIDKSGAEKIVGYGTALYTSRFQENVLNVMIPYISDEDIISVVEQVKSQQTVDGENVFQKSYSIAKQNIELYGTDDDPLYNEVLEFAMESGKISASLIQRRFRLGYNRAARIIDTMEEKGVIGPQNGSKPREVLVGKEDE